MPISDKRIWSLGQGPWVKKNRIYGVPIVRTWGHYIDVHCNDNKRKNNSLFWKWSSLFRSPCERSIKIFRWIYRKISSLPPDRVFSLSPSLPKMAHESYEKMKYLHVQFPLLFLFLKIQKHTKMDSRPFNIVYPSVTYYHPVYTLDATQFL